MSRVPKLGDRRLVKKSCVGLGRGIDGREIMLDLRWRRHVSLWMEDYSLARTLIMLVRWPGRRVVYDDGR